jgi:exodeoxyribonuclease VIII
MMDDTVLEPGRYPGMPEARYFALDAINSSLLKIMGRSPAHCKSAIDGTAPRRETEAQKVGRMIHCAALEPERFESAYCKSPVAADYQDALADLAGYKSAAKALGLKVAGSKADLKMRILEADPDAQFWDDLQERLIGDRSALKPEQWDMAGSIIESIRSNPSASNALSGGTAEESLVWRDDSTQLMCKSRMDYYREDLGIVVDIKTCEDARLDAVTRDINKYGYHKSAAHYLDGLQALGLPGDNFAWIFIEKSAPYAIGLYFASPEMLDRGRTDMREHLDEYATCKETGIWPGYSTTFETVYLPNWAQ